MDVKLQFCDDEEEVFFGEVGLKEQKRSSKYHGRRTVVYSGIRRDRQSLHSTMDRFSLLSLNQNQADLQCDSDGSKRQYGEKLCDTQYGGSKPQYGSDGSELCESPLGSGMSSDSPLGSEGGTTSSSGDQSPVVNGWLDPASLDMLMMRCEDQTSVENVSSLETECGDLSHSEVDLCLPQCNGTAIDTTKCLSLIKDMTHTHVHSFDKPVQIHNKDQAQQDSLESDQSICNSHNVNQSENSFGGSDIDLSVHSIPDVDSVVDESPPMPCIQTPYCRHSVNVDHSPLVNSSTHSGSLSSPHVMLDDLSAVHSATLTDVFSQSGTPEQNTQSGGSNQSHDQNNDQSYDQPDRVPQTDTIICGVSDFTKEQEVPIVVTEQGISSIFQRNGHHDGNIKSEEYFSGDLGHRDLTYMSEDGDVSIVTMGTVMEESMMDTSRRRFSYHEDSSDTDSPHSHLVPDVPLTPGNYTTSEDIRSKALGRAGVIFRERQFSPTLTVITSPQHSDEDTPSVDARLLNPCHKPPGSPPGNPTSSPPGTPTRSPPYTPPRSLDLHSRLYLDQGSSPACTLPMSPHDHRPPDSPLSPADVKFTFLKDSPKRSKIKRLFPGKSCHSEPRPVGVVFDRLNSLEMINDFSDMEEKPKSMKKSSSIRHAHSASRLNTQPRLNTASQLRIAARNSRTNSTPKQSPHPARCTSDKASSIRTVGVVNRQAISQLTANDQTPQQLDKSRNTPTTNTRSTPGFKTPTGVKSTPRSKPTPTGTKPIPGSKSTPVSKSTPGSKSNTESKLTFTPKSTPGLKSAPGVKSVTSPRSPAPVVYRRGTPRYHGGSSNHNVIKPSYSEPVPRLKLDDSEFGKEYNVDKLYTSMLFEFYAICNILGIKSAPRVGGIKNKRIKKNVLGVCQK